MAKDKRKTVFNVAVVGLSGSEQVKGSCGVGKSCLCNRFVREEADNYFPDHTSVLSQSDFSGRIVNNDHFLYWGEVIKNDDGGELKFHVIEQTEFIDDQSYRPHRSSSNQNYFKRCCQTKVSSAEKLMYICTDQLGLESDFEIQVMPEGKLHIDGFIVCFDVSLTSTKAIEDQVNFVQSCLTNLQKTKRPIVMALTKCDELNSKSVDCATKLAASFTSRKGGGIHVVETSASENVNVTSAFLILAQVIDKARAKSKIIQFHASAEERRKILEAAKVELQQLMKMHVTDYHDSWQKSRKNIEDKEAYKRFVYLEGKNAASNIFRKHVNALRDEFRSKLQSKYLHFLPLALSKTLPDVMSLRSTWTETLHVVCKSEYFHHWFIMLQIPNINEWYESEHVSLIEDRRIPYNLLSTPEGERCFLTHRKDLVEKQKKEGAKIRLKQNLVSLSNTLQILPGAEWSEAKSKFSKSDLTDLSSLPDADVLNIYNQFQVEMKEKARNDFNELLLEKTEIFTRNLSDDEIVKNLKTDERFKAMDNMSRERDKLITRYAVEINEPEADDWGAQCLLNVLKKLDVKDKVRGGSRSSLSSSNFSLNSNSGGPGHLSSSLLDLSPYRLKSDSKEINMVLLGSDQLVANLDLQVKNLLTSDGKLEMAAADDNNSSRVYDVTTRIIYGNVCLPNNSFQTATFLPNACIAVYSSMQSLKYIASSLENTVLSKQSNSPPQFYGLSVVIVLAKCPMIEVSSLKEEGHKLSARIGCPFIDASCDARSTTRLKEAIRCLLFSCTSSSNEGSTSSTPDIRVVMCTRKDDLATVEVALSPLLNHSSYNNPLHNMNDQDEAGAAAGELDEESAGDIVEIETFLPTLQQTQLKRRIEITLSSYQNARVLMKKEKPIHGFILVYNTLKRSSFEVMKVFAEHWAESIPKLVLCITPNDSNPYFHNVEARQLTFDGNDLAGKLKAKFGSANCRHKSDTQLYQTFFTETFANKTKTEAALSEHRNSQITEKEEEEETAEEDEEGLTMKPPVPPPRPSKLSVQRRTKASSMDDLVSSNVYIDSSSPPPTRKSVDNNKTTRTTTNNNNKNKFDVVDGGRTTTTSSDSCSDHDTPRTSPTASLLDNEVEQGTRTTDKFQTKTTPTHVQPPSRQSSRQLPSSEPSRIKPGKLDPNLINFVNSNFKPSTGYLSNANTPTGESVGGFPPMRTSNPLRFGAQRVLPLPSGLVRGNIRLPSDTKSDIGLPEYRNGGSKQQPSSGKSPITSRKQPSLQPSQSCTSVNDDLNRSLIQRKMYASSQDDLHRNVPSLLSKSDLNGKPIKEEKSHHHKKDEEKRRKEEKKREREERKIKTKNLSKSNLQLPPSNNLNVFGYFNLELEQIIQGLNHMVPEFVEKCATYVEANGLDSEGIYRKSPNAKERDGFLQRYDKDNEVNFDSIPKITEHMVAGALKWFFSDKHMRVPLIPVTLHHDIGNSMDVSDHATQMKVLADCYRKLPYVNYSTMKFLCRHLNKISKFKDSNKMDAKNLAVCWWPTLFHPTAEVAMQAVSLTREALQLTIVNYDKIFPTADSSARCRDEHLV